MFVDGNGQVLRLGDTYKMPVLAATLKQVARLGVETFYDGAIGDKLIQDVRARGGILTKEDLRQYRLVRINISNYHRFPFSLHFQYFYL